MSPTNKNDVVGRPIEDLDTPSLLIDLDACDHNLNTMAAYFADRSAKLRPHFKNHKCTTLARRQLAAGSAIGMTCAKLAEAEILADAGVENILIANQVVGEKKMPRLAAVAGKCSITVAVDDPGQARAVSRAAEAAGVSVGLLVEVDIGMGRCGVSPGEPALDLVRRIIDLPGTKFRGIQSYEGNALYLDDHEQGARIARTSMQKSIDTRRLIEGSGIEVGVISGGSTGTYEVVGNMEGVDEIQAGTYATLDWRYQMMAPSFKIALSMLLTVISAHDDRAVLDVGIKGAGSEFGPPRILGEPDAEVAPLQSEEHCGVRNIHWTSGSKVQLLTSHACTTCNLHREFIVHQNGRVVDVWPIEGSGALT